MKWSHEQEDIFDYVTSTKDNFLVEASPGSGKTTVSKEIWSLTPNIATLQLAFNKAIVEESTKKYLPKLNSRIQTFNSLGHGVTMQAFPQARLKQDKIYTYIRDREYRFPEFKRNEYRASLAKVVSYAKSNLPVEWYSKRDEESIQELIDYYDLDTYHGIIEDTSIVLMQSIQDTTVIDFADQLLFPVLYELKMPFYELCLVDEAQDVNAVQRELLRRLRLRNPALRYGFVGDSHQAIYAFRGALADSMAVLGQEFACSSLPLTITHRCPVSVCDAASLIWPGAIQPAEYALPGIVREAVYPEREANRTLKPAYRDYSSLLLAETFKTEDLVLCRTTAPLVAFAYQLLRHGVACQLRGREVGQGFIRYIKKSTLLYVHDFIAYAHEDIEPQIQLALSQHKEGKAQALQDKLETLEVFAESCGSIHVEDMIRYIESLFDTGKGVLLSTVHRAKGLEAEKVYILARDLMPHPLSTKPWEKEQEKNIEYVAVTRAKQELVYI